MTTCLRRFCRLALVTLAVASFPLVARASVILAATQDSYLRSGTPDTNYGTSSTLDLITNDGYYRPVVQFDLSGLRTITSATLTLTVNGGFLFAHPIDLYRLTKPWVESEVTWNSSTATTAWTNPGGDGAGPVSSVAVPYNGYGGPLTWDITALAQQWQNGTYPNYGLLVVPEGDAWGVTFASRESSPQPFLTLDVVPEPSQVLLLAVGALTVLGASRRRQAVA